MAGDLGALLEACLLPDNAVRRQAEQALKQLCQQPAIVPELAQHLQASRAPEVRQLAGVLLRKHVSRHWQHLDPGAQRAVQEALLKQLAAEPLHPVRRLAADATAAIAALVLESPGWPELMAFVQQCTQSEAAEHREVALLLLARLAEAAEEAMQPHATNLVAVVAAGLMDPRDMVHSAAARVVEPLLPLLVMPALHRGAGGSGGAKAAAQQLLAALLQRGAAALAGDGSGGDGDPDEAALLLVCQALLACVETPAPLLGPSLPQVLELCMRVAADARLEGGVREQALQLVHAVARCKPRALTRHKALLQAVLGALCAMLTEPLPEGYDDAQDTPSSKLAAQALDSLALGLPSSAVTPSVWAFIGQASGSQDPGARAGALTALAVLAEGCSDALRRRLGAAVPLVVAGLADAAPAVRGAAAFALGQLAEHCAPEVLDHHEPLLAAVFGLLGDPATDVQERACYALDAFCEALEPASILPHLPTLAAGLTAVLTSPTTSPGVVEMALGALASTAGAAGTAFAPYVGPLLPPLARCMSLTAPSHLTVRCRATECVGVIAEALSGRTDHATDGRGGGGVATVGVLHVNPLGAALPEFIEAALSGWALNSSELREYTHSMLYHTARALAQAFAPWLPRAAPLALESMAQPDGVGDADAGPEDGSDLGSEEEGDGGGPPHHRQLSVRTGVMDEKAAAACALGVYAAECGGAFLPFAEATLTGLATLATYWHEEVRAQAFEAQAQVVIALHALFPPPDAPLRQSHEAPSPDGGASAAAARTREDAPAVGLGHGVSSQVRAALAAILPPLLSCHEADMDAPPVTAAATALAALLAALGGRAFSGEEVEGVVALAEGLLEGSALCQEVDGEEDEEAGGPQGEEDEEEGVDPETATSEAEELLAAAVDLLPAVAAAVGPAAFAPVFAQRLAPPLLARLRPRQPEGVRALAAGGVAEVAQALEGAMPPDVVRAAMQPLLSELRGEDPINRQNAVFALGCLAAAAPQAAHPSLHQLLAAAAPLLRDASPGVRDNAAGAVGRLVLAYGGALPLEQAVPAWLAALPPQEDLGEALPVAQALAQLASVPELASRITPHGEQLVRVCAAVAAQAGAPAPARRIAAHTVLDLQRRHGDQLSSLLASLPAEHQAAVQAWV